MDTGHRAPRIAAALRRVGGVAAGVAALPGLHAGYLERDPVSALLWGLVAAVIWAHASAAAWVVEGFVHPPPEQPD